MIIKEYAKIKLEELEKERKKYADEENEIKQKLNEIESRLEELKKQQEGLVVKQKFSFIEKLITKRKDYKIMKLIKELQQEYDEEKKVVYLKWEASGKEKRFFEIVNEISAIELLLIRPNEGITILEAIKFLESRGIQPVLTEEDKVIFPHPRNYSSKSSLIGVHKTRYAPTGDIIRTAQDANAIDNEGSITINGIQYEYSWTSGRDTVHMAMNGEVSSHDFGEWDDCKYAILIPFDDIPNEKIGCAEPMDTFTKGNIELTENSWILCPKNEVKRIKTFNPKVHVLGYEGENVQGFSGPFLSQLGYRAETVRSFGWDDHQSDLQFSDLMEKEEIDRGPHMYTYFKKDEEIVTGINKIIAICKLLRDNDLVKTTEDIENINSQLRDKFGSLFSFLNRIDLYCTDSRSIKGGQKEASIFIQKMKKNGFYISPVYQHVIQKISLLITDNYEAFNTDQKEFFEDYVFNSSLEASEEEQRTIEKFKSALNENGFYRDETDKNLKNENKRRAFNEFILTVLLETVLHSREKEITNKGQGER